MTDFLDRHTHAAPGEGFAIENGVAVVGGRPYRWGTVNVTPNWAWVGFRLPLENGWEVGAMWSQTRRTDGVVEADGTVANVWVERSGFDAGDIRRLRGGWGKDNVTADEFHQVVADAMVRHSPSAAA